MSRLRADFISNPLRFWQSWLSGWEKSWNSFLETVSWFGTNPITLREFIRYSRSLRFWGFLALLLCTGTFILCMVWSYYLTQDPSIQVGRRLFYSLLATEIAVIILLLPGIVSHSLITEREQDTYPLLLTTPLSPGQIIAGKLVSTLGVMVLLIIATFPLIGICVARGGVSPREMIAGPLYLILFSFIVASFSIYNALNAKSTLNAILQTHLSLFLAILVGGAALAFWLGIIFSILGILAQIVSANSPLLQQFSITKIWFWTFTLSATPLSIAIALWILRSSQSRIRFVESQERTSWNMERAPYLYERTSNNQNETKNQPRSWWEFQDGMNPYYIQERLTYAALFSYSGTSSWYVIILLCHVLFLLTPIAEGQWVSLFVLFALGQMVPAYAGQLFAREKEKDTWELLLTTLCQSRAILHGKLGGAIMQCLPRLGVLFGLPFLIAYGLLMIPYLVSPELGRFFGLHHLFFYSVILLIQFGFLLIITTYFSLCLPRIVNAISAGYAVIAGLFVFPYLIDFTILRLAVSATGEYFLAISPIYMIRSVSRVTNFFHPGQEWWMLLGIYIVFYGFATILFYTLSLRRLQSIR